MEPGSRWYADFTAISYLRAGRLLPRFFKKRMESKLEMHGEHVRAEGENLKRLMESG
jgi:hypothetical protein